MTTSRCLDDDEFSDMYQRELDHLNYLESTKRDKKRIERQRERCEIFAQVAAES